MRLQFAIVLFLLFSNPIERGEISPNAAGIATAILCQASELEPNSNAPIVALETGKKYVSVVNLFG